MASRAITVDHAHHNKKLEKRNWFRTRTVYRLVKVEVRGQQSFGRVHNISDGGICLETSVPARSNDTVQIFFTNDLALGGRVIWRAAGRCGVQFDSPVNCRDLLAEATQRCLRGTGEPLTLWVEAPIFVCCEQDTILTTLREISPLLLRLDAQPRIGAGQAATIALPSGAKGRGVIRASSEGQATFLLCTPLSTDEIGHFRCISKTYG